HPALALAIKAGRASPVAADRGRLMSRSPLPLRRTATTAESVADLRASRESEESRLLDLPDLPANREARAKTGMTAAVLSPSPVASPTTGPSPTPTAPLAPSTALAVSRRPQIQSQPSRPTPRRNHEQR